MAERWNIIKNLYAWSYQNNLLQQNTLRSMSKYFSNEQKRTKIAVLSFSDWGLRDSVKYFLEIHLNTKYEVTSTQKMLMSAVSDRGRAGMYV